MKIIYVCVIMLISSLGIFAQDYHFGNKLLDPEERIEDLLSLMTLNEKVSCLGTNPSVPRLGLEATGHVEGLHGLAMGEPGNWGGDQPIPTSTFPQAYGMGQTWDTTSMRILGEVEGYEVRYMAQSPKYKRGGLVVRAPNADLCHDPRWGRTEECYGEDPFLNGTLVVSFIKGLQGNDPKYWQAASLMKHFLANSNEDTRTSSSSNFDERLLHEYYALPFQMGVEQGGSRAYMAAYNKVNQIPMMVSPLLKDLTVNQWGQNGIICTDGGALKLLITHHNYYNSIEMGAAMAVKSGINQFLDDYEDGIWTALDKNLITEKDIDEVLKGTFRVMIKLGLLDQDKNNPFAKIGLNGESEPWLSKKNQKLVREVTQKSIVLLKNDYETLPVKSKIIKKIAVIGQLANKVLLDWYSGTPPYTLSPLQGLKNRIGDEVEVIYVPDSLMDDALLAAKEADLVLAFGGNHPTGNAGWEKVTRPSYGKEAVDRKTIVLEDETWIKQLYEVNQNTVLVLVSSFPYAINWSQHNLPAIVHITHNSQEMGNALAAVLVGDYNPAGRLVQNWPVSDDVLPPLLDYNIRNGHTYMYAKYPPIYPFGYGLSYSYFKYDNLKVSQTDGELSIDLTVTNTSSRDGDEVVQVYVSFPNSRVARPKIALKGFVRQTIRKGKTKQINIPINLDNLCYWSEVDQDMILENGDVEILVGASSTDIRLKKVVKID